MKGNSEVVDLMRKAKLDAWGAWYRHVTGPLRSDISYGEWLWREYQHAALVYRGEVEGRDELLRAVAA